MKKKGMIELGERLKKSDPRAFDFWIASYVFDFKLRRLYRTMYRKKMQRSIFANIFAFVVLAAGCAYAHLPVVDFDGFSFPVESSVKLTAGLAEPLITMAYSPEHLLAVGYAGNPGVANLSGAIFYANGEKTVLAPKDFAPVNTTNPSDTDPANSGASVATFKIEKPGTVAATTRLDFNSGTRPTVAFGKTFINRTTDGLATRRLGGDDVLEIVFTDDTASAAVKTGDTVNAQVFLRGKPLANAEVSATYDGAPKHTDSDEPDNNEYLHADTNADGRVAFVVDRAAKWVIGIEYVDEAFDPQNAAYTPSAGVRYRATILLPVTSN
jgi:hypothetical protein